MMLSVVGSGPLRRRLEYALHRHPNPNLIYLHKFVVTWLALRASNRIH